LKFKLLQFSRAVFSKVHNNLNILNSVSTSYSLFFYALSEICSHRLLIFDSSRMLIEKATVLLSYNAPPTPLIVTIKNINQKVMYVHRGMQYIRNK